MSRILRLEILLAASLGLAGADTLKVGPQQRFQLPCQALTSARDGDVIEIDAAGTYVGDACVFSASNLIVRGVNGRARIDAGGAAAQGKGIWVVQGHNNTFENIEAFGARVPDRNGAVIRLEGVGLTLRRVYFHDNEQGVLSVGLNGDILIEYSEFDYNGDNEGYAHNIYFNNERSLTIRYSYFHRSLGGNVIKSRAAENYLYYNVFASEGANSSWEVDLPNGGLCLLVGNVIQQGPLSENINLLSYMLEGAVGGRTNLLLVTNNTFVNEGRPELDGTPAYFILPADSGYAGFVQNNIFAGQALLMPDKALANFKVQNNLMGVDPGFLEPALGDYRIPENSPAAGQATAIPAELSALLTPVLQYQAPACAQPRPSNYPPALGAFEPGIAEPNLTLPCTVSNPLDYARLTPTISTLKTSVTQAARVNLAGVAPAGGAVVRLVSSHPALIPVPAQVTIPEGESSALLPLTNTVPAAPTYVTLSAIYGERSTDTTIYFNVPVVLVPGLSRLSLAPSTLTGGQTSSGNVVQLNTGAPQGGLTVSLTSSDPGLVTVPASVVVPQGAVQASFQVTTKEVAVPTEVTITAQQGNNVYRAKLLVAPTTISRVEAPSATMGAPGSYTGRVYLSGAAPAGGVLVQLSSTAPEALAVPSSVSVAAGATRASFRITTNAVSAAVSGEIRGTAGTVTRTSGFTVQQMGLASVALAPASITGGLASGANRVVLSGPAFDGTPVTVRLRSSDPSVASVPAEVVIPAGATSAPFQIVTARVASLTQVEITAEASAGLPGGSSASATLGVKP
ncbi:MAG: right-handed parallel beta-helix repeat-containing protein [Acidobacteria bacterium]|nr:right-handed parallel beta-helix repeat-containing protein [Acidobacteriota bacterium]